MQMATRIDTPVLIAGAGPVGLLAALQLARLGVDSTVIEAEPGLTIDLRAGTFHPPTLEMLEDVGVTGPMLERGIKVPVWQSWDLDHGLVAQWDLSLLASDTRYPFRLHLEQHRLTPILMERLRDFPGVRVLFSHRFEGLQQHDDHVAIDIAGPDGPLRMRAGWMVGADGGRSQVRKSAGIEFAGYTWPERYSVISTRHDFAGQGFTENAYISDPVQWCAVFKMPDEGPPGLWRMTLPVASDVSDEQALAGPYAQRCIRRLTGHGDSVNYSLVHQSIYSVHQRVAVQMRKGRVLLAGDAAHVNNPLGGFGLNSGIHDAMNLGEKLAMVAKGEAGESLLDRYHRQRHTVNVEYVQTLSVRNKQNLEVRDPVERIERIRTLKSTVADPAKAREYLLNSSMINSIRRVATID
jgi:3-(3-hydroxy-phenyl)propionate hydroxylase